MTDANGHNLLRLIILRHCLEEAIQIGTLLEAPELKGFNRDVIIRMVHACALAGLLDARGLTSGRWYQTNRVGWVVLTILEGNRR